MNGKPIILIVDNEEESLELLCKIFKEEDYTVLTAANSKEALELVETERPNLAILNLNASDMNEIKILRRIKKIDENIEVLIITDYGTMKAARTAMELGAYDYVTKPFDNDYIRALIKNIFSPVPGELLQLELK